MPRYYFNVRHGQHVFVDPHGIEFADLNGAQSHAKDDARLISDEKLLVGDDIFEQWVEVNDDMGNVLAMVPLTKADGSQPMARSVQLQPSRAGR